MSLSADSVENYRFKMRYPCSLTQLPPSLTRAGQPVYVIGSEPILEFFYKTFRQNFLNMYLSKL